MKYPSKHTKFSKLLNLITTFLDYFEKYITCRRRDLDKTSQRFTLFIFYLFISCYFLSTISRFKYTIEILLTGSSQ